MGYPSEGDPLGGSVVGSYWVKCLGRIAWTVLLRSFNSMPGHFIAAKFEPVVESRILANMRTGRVIRFSILHSVWGLQHLNSPSQAC